MGLLLNVPYAEKDEAKALGARWNPEIKKWYAPSPYKYPNFYKCMGLPTSCIPPGLWKYIDETFHFHEGYSKQGGTYRANHCHFCGAIQGEFYLFAEPDSPFFINSPSDASQLVLYKFHLKNDLILGDVINGDSPCDAFIKPNAKIIETNQGICNVTSIKYAYDILLKLYIIKF